MMLKLLPVFLLLFCLLADASAQSPDKKNVNPCGAPPRIDPWLLRFKSSPSPISERNADTLLVGVQVHLTAKDDGASRFFYDRLLDAFCRLNSDFEASAVRFYFKNDWNLINNTAWWDHDDIVQGIEMMFENNYPDVLNAYFCGTAAGNCGYNLPYAGVAIMHGCAGADDHTWTHEVGHALSLPHPFIGWEGKNYNYNNPTPDTLTYDYTHFHETPDTIVPAPLDTALVEYVDGSNCIIAADLFCDTKPDYQSARWTCNGEGLSPELQKDPNGIDFRSDSSLYMSYADDACQNRFSPEQIEALRANLLSEKIAWLSQQPLFPVISETSTLVSPINDETTPNNNFSLHWTAVPNASHYVVSGSRVASFPIRDFQFVTTDTTVTIVNALQNNRKYYWRVRPFNAGYTCTDFSAVGSFVTAPVSATTAPGSPLDVQVFPSLLTDQSSLMLRCPGGLQRFWVSVLDMNGQVMWSGYALVGEEAEALEAPVHTWPAGSYIVRLQTSEQILSRRIVLLK